MKRWGFDPARMAIDQPSRMAATRSVAVRPVGIMARLDSARGRRRQSRVVVRC
jgi:hypothetical protein